MSPFLAIYLVVFLIIFLTGLELWLTSKTRKDSADGANTILISFVWPLAFLYGIYLVIRAIIRDSNLGAK